MRILILVAGAGARSSLCLILAYRDKLPFVRAEFGVDIREDERRKCFDLSSISSAFMGQQKYLLCATVDSPQATQRGFRTI